VWTFFFGLFSWPENPRQELKSRCWREFFALVYFIEERRARSLCIVATAKETRQRVALTVQWRLQAQVMERNKNKNNLGGQGVLQALLVCMKYRPFSGFTEALLPAYYM